MIKMLAKFVLMLTAFSIQTGHTTVLSHKEYAFAFGPAPRQGVASAHDGYAVLSHPEMIATEGEWIGEILRRALNNIRVVFKNTRIKFHYDRKPHDFKQWWWGPLRGNRPHYQITIWQAGKKRSNIDFRFPVGRKQPYGGTPKGGNRHISLREKYEGLFYATYPNLRHHLIPLPDNALLPFIEGIYENPWGSYPDHVQNNPILQSWIRERRTLLGESFDIPGVIYAYGFEFSRKWNSSRK